jgi:acetylglutamate kinase
VETVVVHGGGKQMTRYPGRARHREPVRERPARHHAEVLDAVLKVFAGSVNHELVAAFAPVGAPAVGLSGIDAGLAEAEPLTRSWDLWGNRCARIRKLLEVLTPTGCLPVVACVAGDRRAICTT